MKKKSLTTLGLIMLVCGAILMALLGIVSAWGDIEATVFNSTIKSNKPLSSLRCPALITPKDDAFVSAQIDNPSDRDLEMEIRTYISDGYVVLMKEITTNFDLQSGESEIVRVPIRVSDAAYDRVVLVRMHQISRGPLPYLNASCGVVVVNVPFLTGKQLVILGVGLGTLLCIMGFALWTFATKPDTSEEIKVQRFFIFYMIISLLVCLSGLSALWLLTVLLFIVWLLMGIGEFGQILIKDIVKS